MIHVIRDFINSRSNEKSVIGYARITIIVANHVSFSYSTHYQQ